MITRLFLLCIAVLPLVANAEIYKWKDKDGVTRYSDVPPPSNVKQEAIQGKKLAKPTGQAPLAPVEGDITSAMNKNKATGKAKEGVLSPEDAAKKRAQDAESQKIAEQRKQAEQKANQENCLAAKKNLATYMAGGRISRINDAGEREYLGDDDVARGKVESQKEVDTYCN